MEDSWNDPLPLVVARAKPIAQKLRGLKNGTDPVAFSHVTEPAQAFLVAGIASHVERTIWVACPTVRSQEFLYESLLNWLPDALFLPEAEFAAVENILPDPELAAERLALLSQVETQKNQVIIATRAALDQAAPNPAALKSAMVKLHRNLRRSMEEIIETLNGAGYERARQVTTRGQFAVRGGILDLYSWQAPRPVRVEFFDDDIESLREFDVDTQTSVRNLDKIEILLGGSEDQTGNVRDYIRPDHLRIEVEPGESPEADILIGEGWLGGDEPEDFSGAFENCDIGDFAVGDFMLVEAKRTQFSKWLADWRKKRRALSFTSRPKVRSSDSARSWKVCR